MSGFKKMEKKKWYKRWWAIVLYIFIGIIILSVLFSDSETNQAEEKTGSKNEPVILQVDIKNALDEWSKNLPTEYKLGEINPYCSQKQDKSCESIDSSSKIVEGYSITFAKGTDDMGKGAVYLFNTQEDAKQQYENIVNGIKEERGYKEIKVSDDCFGWEKDMTVVTVQGIVCHKLNSVYQVGLQKMFSLSSSEIKEFSKQLGEKLM